MRQLSAADAFMLYTESPNTPNQIASLGIFDPSTAPEGTLTFDQFMEYFRGRIHLTKAFRQRMVRVPFDLDRPWWVQDESFDLEYHLRHTALPSPGSWEQLSNLVARLHARPLDLTRPPWEAYLIEGLDAVGGVPTGSVAILQRFHHCAVDGVGGVEVLSALFQLSPDDPPPDTSDTWRPEPLPGPWDLLGRAALANVTKPVRLAGRLTSALPDIVRLPRQLGRREVQLPTLSVPTTRFNAKVSPHRAFGSYLASLDDLKGIRKAVPGSTINDVILAVCGGALRRYLGDLGELPEASLAAAVPVSLRSGPAGQEGNEVAQLFCDLHTDVADPLERLAAVAETTRIAKGSQPALGAQALIQISGNLPGALFGLALRANAELGERMGSTSLLNTQISNVPGPPTPLYCVGAKLLSLYGLGPVITGAALIHVVMSYCDQVTFSFTSDRDLTPDPEHYARCLGASLEELVEAAVAEPDRTKAKKRSTAPTVAKAREEP